jgi:hypothetical protein
VVGAFRKAVVSGDPAVLAAVAEGPHLARQEGDTLVISSESWDPGSHGFVFSHGRSAHEWRLGHHPLRLVVRMHPDLPLEVEMSAGALSVAGVRGPIQARVAAGSAKIDGLAAPLTASVDAGSLKVSGVLQEGASRVRCNAGSVVIHLERGSSLRIRARAELGSIVLPDGPEMAWVAGRGDREVTVGDGAASLDVETSMGNIRVSADR